MTTYTKKIDFVAMWIADKKSIIATMYRNMQADIDCGYDVAGACIRRQLAEISAYSNNYERELMAIANMTEENANRWAYYDMIRRGAIE